MTVKPDKPGYIIGTPMNLGAASPTGRSTRAYRALSIETGNVVFLKDTWRIRNDQYKAEHLIYEKLHKAKVSNIPTLIEGHDIENQRTKTHEMANKHTHGEMRVLQHYRLVLKDIGRDLTSFNDTKELLTAVRDSVIAHREAYFKANVLHCDISTGNILIRNNGGGLLIDWDLCKDLDDESGLPPNERVGTWYFMAARLQAVGLRAPEFKDDLESFFLVMTYVVLFFTEHTVPPGVLSYMVNYVFEPFISPTDVRSSNLPMNSFSKRFFVLDGLPAPACSQYSHLVPLLESIRSTVAVRYERPPSEQEAQHYRGFLQIVANSREPEETKHWMLNDNWIHSYYVQKGLLEEENWLKKEINKALLAIDWSGNCGRLVHAMTGKKRKCSDRDDCGGPLLKKKTNTS